MISVYPLDNVKPECGELFERWSLMQVVRAGVESVPMEFDNSFEIPLPPDDAWPVLMDVARIAPCMPGAELTEIINPQNYRGKISVRLGPVALAFAGKVALEDVDDVKHTARVKAQGTDAKGRGAANAAATFKVESKGNGSVVLIHTDLMLSGPVAQYGRGVGMIQATAAQIIGQFANNLRVQLAQQPAISAPAASASATPASAAAPKVAVPAAAKPISGLSLMLRVVLQQVAALLGRRSRS